MIKVKKRLPFGSKTIFFLLIALINGIVLRSQSNTNIKFQSKELTAAQIIAEWTKTSKAQYNFDPTILPSGQFTFSAEGSLEEVASIIFEMIGLESVQFDSDITILRKGNSFNQLQKYKRSLRVIDEYGISLPFAHVAIPSLNYLNVTNERGEVILNFPTASSDTLIVQYVGYKNLQRVFGEIFEQNATLRLEPQTNALQEVVIIGEYTTQSNIEKIYSGEVPQAASVDQDALTVVSGLPGISNPSESFQDLIIRGGSPDQVQYHWNGIQLLQPAHFFGKVSSINPFMIDRIEITKDGYSAESSGSVGGGLNMKSKQNVDKTEISAHVNFLYANIGFAQRINSKIWLRGAFRRSLPNSLQTSLVDKFTNQIFQFGNIPDFDYYQELFNLQEIIESDTDVSYADNQLSAKILLSSNLVAGADWIDLNNNLNFTTSSEFLDQFSLSRLNQNNSGFHVFLNYNFGSQFHSRIDFNQSNYNYDFNEIPDIARPDSLDRLQTNEVLLRGLEWKNNIDLRLLSLGFGYEYKSWDSEIEDEQPARQQDYFSYDRTAHEHALYLKLSPRINDKLQIDAGVRWSDYSRGLNGRKLLEPRIHGHLIINDELSLDAHYGHFHQTINKRNFFTPLQADNGFWFLSDETNNNYIGIIESRQYSSKLKWNNPNWTNSISAYRKKTFNIWTSVFDFSIEENPYKFGDLEVRGIELSTQYRDVNHIFQINYDYTYERLMIDDLDEDVTSPFSQPHRLTAIAQKKWGWLSTTLQYNYATGRPFSEAALLRNLVNDDGEAFPNILFDNLLGMRVPDYHRLDLSLTATLRSNQHQNKFGVQFTNLLNRTNTIKNQYFIDYKVDPRELGFLNKQGIPFAFNIFWEYRFN